MYGLFYSICMEWGLLGCVCCWPLTAGSVCLASDARMPPLWAGRVVCNPESIILGLLGLQLAFLYQAFLPG